MRIIGKWGIIFDAFEVQWPQPRWLHSREINNQ